MKFNLTLLLLLTACAPLCLPAQDVNSPGQTNDLLQTDQAMAADGSQATDALADDQSADTNNVADTNELITPGPDGRARRLRRRPPSRPRDLNGQARPGSSATNNSASPFDYSAFQLIAERNIFDPNRAPRSIRNTTQPKTTDSFTLVGTMSYEKGIFAFFDGNSSDYKKVLKPDESIAGYKVAAISPESVKLMLSTNALELKVGTQMRRRDDGSWEVNTSAGSYAATPASSQTEAAPTGAESDVLKKLMQRREKE